MDGIQEHYDHGMYSWHMMGVYCNWGASKTGMKQLKQHRVHQTHARTHAHTHTSTE